MPGLAHCNKYNRKKSAEKPSLYANGSDSGFWSNDVTFNHLHKFWVELPTQARQELLRIDKQTLIEQARKNMYCSRCNGLLLEIFVQIVMYGKSLPQEGQKGNLPFIRQGTLKSKNDNDLDLKTLCKDGVEDPSIHLWGGLKTTIDGILTLLDCYLYAKSLKGLQIVFDSARARERERELLYPDACGGGGRGWISQGIYGRGHGTREACALHTARLSVDTLVDFWSALGEETRLSLLKMKEEDFIERLMYRFDSKRFCRDCRRNVIREFKELKEIKRMCMEPRCTSWFCVADTAFLYEVSHDSVMADWHETFADNIRKYHHFEWGVGTGEGKSDILEFEDVGLRGRVQVSGLDLGGLSACYITLRAWKITRRCSEYSVKAHALKGQQCVHCKLVVGDGDGCVTINNRGESIQSFFEHAEEAEEEEDDYINNDGNDLDGECSRPQKHAKTPELAREFLLNAATVIFKEQVEKAFREGIARQNAHSIFVSLALNLLEERVHVAYKEIITLEKQTKLLEEEEKEKREEEERKERKRTKEREKKLRRKERLRLKDKKSSVSSESPNVLDDDDDEEDDSPSSCEKIIVINDLDIESSNIEDKHVLDDSIVSEKSHLDEGPEGEFTKLNNNDISYPDDHSETKFQKESWSEASEFSVVCETRYDGFEAYSQSSSGWNKKSHGNPTKSNVKNNGSRCGERFHFTTRRMSEKHDFNSYSSCNRHSDYRLKPQDVSKQYYRVNKYNNQTDYANEKPKSKATTGNNFCINRDSPHIKKIWEPIVRKYPRSNSDDTNIMSQVSTFKSENCVADKIKLSGAISFEELSGQVDETGHKENNLKAHEFSKDTIDGNTKACEITTSYLNESKVKPTSVSSGSDNCSSCFSEGDSNTNNSSKETSESEEDNSSKDCEVVKIRKALEYSLGKDSLSKDILPTRQAHNMENMQPNVSNNSQIPSMVPSVHNSSIPFPMYQAPPSAMGYYQQSLVSWGLPAHTNGIFPFYPQSHYVFPSPFEYGIQYGTYQHPTPLVNSGQGPTYQPVVRTNESNPKDQTVTRKTCEAQESFGKVSTERTVPMPNGNSKKPHGGNSGFSLFHFGSPVALPAEYELNTTVPCNNKKESIEEYNLFATSNGMMFPFF